MPIPLTPLQPAEVELFALVEGVRRIAVENFLGSLHGLSEHMALMNAEMDAGLYRWEDATLSAICEGIKYAATGILPLRFKIVTTTGDD